MTNTQTKVARLTARVNTLEAAIREILILANPNMGSEDGTPVPAYYKAWNNLSKLVAKPTTETLSCGCVVTAGWRCPTHDAP